MRAASWPTRHIRADLRFAPFADRLNCRWHEPALLLGEPISQHVDERVHLGAQVPSVGIERADLQLLRRLAGQRRHQRSRGQQIADRERDRHHQADAGQGGVHGVGAAADQASRYARNDRIAIGIQKVPPVGERCVGVEQAVVAGEVCRG
jgi:hypothetical protein